MLAQAHAGGIGVRKREATAGRLRAGGRTLGTPAPAVVSLSLAPALGHLRILPQGRKQEDRHAHQPDQMHAGQPDQKLTLS